MVLFPYKDNQYCGLESKCRVAKGMSGMRGKRVTQVTWASHPARWGRVLLAGWAGPQGNDSFRKVVINTFLTRDMARKTLLNYVLNKYKNTFINAMHL